MTAVRKVSTKEVINYEKLPHSLFYQPNLLPMKESGRKERRKRRGECSYKLVYVCMVFIISYIKKLV
jgi:hypothetical protein